MNKKKEVFIWESDSMTPKLASQMARDGYDIEYIPELKAVMVSR